MIIQNKINPSPVYNVLIIGAGHIGCLYDQPGSENVVTHAHAFSAPDSGFHLLGFTDTDKAKMEHAAATWGGRCFNSIEEALDNNRVDIVCLCVPEESHYSYLQRLLRLDIKLIFAEKPLVRHITEAQDIRELYNHSPVEIAVNYIRRFVPEFSRLYEMIRSGTYGNYISGNAYYGKGLVHNGSHVLDLLHYFFDTVQVDRILRKEYDFYKDDPSISALFLVNDSRPFYLQTLDGKAYSFFEMNLFFKNKRIRIADGGSKIEEYDVEEEKVFKGHKKLSLHHTITTSLSRHMYYAAQNIYEYLNDDKPLLCTFQHGYQVVEMCHKINDTLKD